MITQPQWEKYSKRTIMYIYIWLTAKLFNAALIQIDNVCICMQNDPTVDCIPLIRYLEPTD